MNVRVGYMDNGEYSEIGEIGQTFDAALTWAFDCQQSWGDLVILLPEGT